MLSVYEDLKQGNIIRLLSGMLRSGAIDMRGSDNKFVANLRVEWDTPWVYTKNSYRMNCFLWKTVTFHEIVEKQIPREKWFVPAGCQDCFKVVVRPKTLQQLFALEALEKRFDHPSKCGIEIRPTVFGNYGGYFYNRGLREGLECYKKVRAAVNEDPLLGPDVAVILKRACTEMEHGLGRSDHWKITPEQIELEIRIAELFVNDVPVLRQTDHAKNNIRQRWIERAYEVGDETYALFTGGKPLYPGYVTYHHLAEEGNKQDKTTNSVPASGQGSAKQAEEVEQ